MPELTQFQSAYSEETFVEDDKAYPEDQIVYRFVRTIPDDLLTEKEMMNRLPFTKSEWRQIVKTGMLPCWRFKCSSSAFYREKEVKHWIASNYMERIEGGHFARIIRLHVPADHIKDPPPTAISHIEELRQMPGHDYHPGVYFLCDGNEVVYVGQSIVPGGRISAHVLQGDKDFDRAYILHFPQHDLLEMELRFIKLLKPRFNKQRIAPEPEEVQS